MKKKSFWAALTGVVCLMACNSNNAESTESCAVDSVSVDSVAQPMPEIAEEVPVVEEVVTPVIAFEGVELGVEEKNFKNALKAKGWRVEDGLLSNQLAGYHVSLDTKVSAGVVNGLTVNVLDWDCEEGMVWETMVPCYNALNKYLSKVYGQPVSTKKKGGESDFYSETFKWETCYKSEGGKVRLYTVDDFAGLIEIEISK